MINTSVADGVMHIRFSRPERKNALTLDMYQQLIDAFNQASADPQISCVLIAGNENCFTAGNDLNDFLNIDYSQPELPTRVFLQTLLRFDKPLIAAVAGPAIGIGTTLLLHCDMVVAADNSKFAMPFTGLGLCPEAGSSILLEKYVGRRRAQELLLLGQKFNAQQAADWGLINQAVAPENLFATAERYCQAICQLPDHATQGTRKLLSLADIDKVAQQINDELDHFFDCLKQPETRDRLQSFFAK